MMPRNNSEYTKQRLAPSLSLLLLLTSSCSFDDQRGRTSAFKVLVVAEGAEQLTASEQRQYPVNRAEATAMLSGIKLALDRAARVSRVTDRVPIELEIRDDFGEAVEAAAIAQHYKLDPSVLAVIGHSSSGTTAAALHHYEDASIPVLMPIPTSPNVAGRSAFRLPLNDTVGQAPAIAHLLTRLLESQAVHIIYDISAEAEAYSQPLGDSLMKLLPPNYYRWDEEVDVRDLGFDSVAHSIKAQRADTIVFLGYGSTAVRLLNSLRSEFPNEEDRPRVVLSDGGIIPDLDISGFDVFLTAPAPPLSAARCHGPDIGLLRDTQPPGELPSYKVFGYDSMLILAEAMDKCLANYSAVSRECVVLELRRSRGIGGVCSEYVFRDGENLGGAYYIYRGSMDNGRFTLSLLKELTGRDLREITEAHS